MSDTAQFRSLVRMVSSPNAALVVRRMMHVLYPWIDVDDAHRAELILSELVSNAVRHGSRNVNDEVEVEVLAWRDRIVGFVRDCGPSFGLEDSRVRTPDEHGGFGLHIVEQLTEALDVRRSAAGNEVRFVIDVNLSRLLDV